MQHANWEHLLSPHTTRLEVLPRELLAWVDGDRNALNPRTRHVTFSARERAVRQREAARSETERLTR